MHPAKRKKLDQPQPFFNKPFRSPLRVGTGGEPNTDSCNQASKKQVHHPLPPPVDEDAKPGSSPTLANVDIIQSQQKTQVYTGVNFKDLSKQHTVLSIRLTQLRKSLEIAEHALKIEASSEAAQLESLIIKWRVIAQEAADELFTDAKDRVDRMGGMTAWRREHGKQDLDQPKDSVASANEPDQHDSVSSEEEIQNEGSVSQGWLVPISCAH